MLELVRSSLLDAGEVRRGHRSGREQRYAVYKEGVVLNALTILRNGTSFEMRQQSHEGLRVVLADDHLVLRDGLKAILTDQRMEVVGEASDGLEAIKLCETLTPDVAVLDISMPVLNGIDAAREISKVSPKTKIIILTMITEDRYVFSALRAGASGYVLKSKASSNLVDAIDTVCKGEFYLSTSVSKVVVNAYLSKVDAPTDPLSIRERQVLQLIAEGKNVKEIGGILGISAKTAESHRTNIMNKLDIHDVAGLVRYAIREGLVQIE
jgi:DNA-binding NarL/FixJ family response regulator